MQKSIEQPQTTTFPACINKKQARLVCLNQECKDYPFFCTNCEDDSCQIIHQHGNKLQSVGFKQFIKRVLKDKKINEQLEKALIQYQRCLEQLKKDIEQFIQTQFKEIQEIRRKASQVPGQVDQVIKKLKDKQYETLQGSQLDKIWSTFNVTPQDEQNQKETIEFLKMKQLQIAEISKNFEIVNKMEQGQEVEEQEKPEGDNSDNNPKKEKEENNAVS